MAIDGRTKATVDAGIVSSQGYRDGRFIEYQPGNGTRYEVLFQWPDPGKAMRDRLGWQEGTFLVTLLSTRPAKTVILGPVGYLAVDWLMEKWDISVSDAVVLAELIAHVTDRTTTDHDTCLGKLPIARM